MSPAIRKPSVASAALLVSAAVAFAQSPDPAADAVKQGRELLNDQKDSVVLAMIAKAYTRLEDYTRRMLTIYTHNAFGRPMALLPPPA